MQGQSIAIMQLKALYRLKFGLSYLDSIKYQPQRKWLKTSYFDILSIAA
jgi:hypothetical protein